MRSSLMAVTLALACSASLACSSTASTKNFSADVDGGSTDGYSDGNTDSLTNDSEPLHDAPSDVAGDVVGDVAEAASEAASDGPDANPDPDADPDGPVVECPPDQHACGGTCLANEPEKGCAVQCEPCLTPDWSIPKCSPTGACDFDCLPSCERFGSGCTCPNGPGCCDYHDCGEGTDYYACRGGLCNAELGCYSDTCSQFCTRCSGKQGACAGTYPNQSCICS